MSGTRREFVLGALGIAGAIVVSCGTDPGTAIGAGDGSSSRSGAQPTEPGALSEEADLSTVLAALRGTWEIRRLRNDLTDRIEDPSADVSLISDAERAAWWILDDRVHDATPMVQQFIDQALLTEPGWASAVDRREHFVEELHDEVVTSVQLGDGEATVANDRYDEDLGLDGEVPAAYEVQQAADRTSLSLSWRLSWTDMELSGHYDFRARYTAEVADGVGIARLTSVAVVDEEGSVPTVTAASDPFCAFARLWWSEDRKVGTLLARTESMFDYMGSSGSPGDPDAAAGIDCERFSGYTQDDWDAASEQEWQDEAACHAASQTIPRDPEHMLFLLVRR